VFSCVWLCAREGERQSESLCVSERVCMCVCVYVCMCVFLAALEVLLDCSLQLDRC